MRLEAQDSPPRILYGVQGEGRGHATRSLEVIRGLLEQGYTVKVLSGGDALPVLRQAGLHVTEIPLIRYQYSTSGRLSPWRTVTANTPKALGLLCRTGIAYEVVRRQVEAFQPDLCISDFEPYLSRIARKLRMPLVAIDHQHFLTETLLPRPDRLGKAFVLGLFRIGTLLLGGKPDRIITSSFWHFPRRPGSRAMLVGPFLASGMKSLQPVHGDHVVVYMKRAGYLNRLLPALRENPGRCFSIFSDWSDWRGAEDLPSHVQLLPVHRQVFLAALSQAHSLITTAGNQVIGEAIFLGKPVLAFPEPEVLEQELNATALERSGYGQACELSLLSGERLQRFLHAVPALRERIQAGFTARSDYDGGEKTFKTLQRMLRSRLGKGRFPVFASPQGISPAFASSATA